MPASTFALRRLRSPQELQDAAATLRRNGFTRCDSCSTWHNEDMRCAASGSAWDTHCPACGATPIPAED